MHPTHWLAAFAAVFISFLRVHFGKRCLQNVGNRTPPAGYIGYIEEVKRFTAFNSILAAKRVGFSPKSDFELFKILAYVIMKTQLSSFSRA